MRIFLILVLLSCAGMSQAAPRTYLLNQQGSQVVFTWFLGSDAVKGNMPVKRADLVLDFERAANSTVDVALDVSKAQAGFPFATTAMTGPKVLDAGTYPEITFRSTRVIARGAGAEVQGDLTIRGVTLPAVFMAQIYQGQGAVTGDRAHLTVLLTGSVSRAAYGATGWADMAGDEVRFQVLAQVDAVN